jgi:hypothetical protein
MEFEGRQRDESLFFPHVPKVLFSRSPMHGVSAVVATSEP